LETVKPPTSSGIDGEKSVNSGHSEELFSMSLEPGHFNDIDGNAMFSSRSKSPELPDNSTSRKEELLHDEYFFRGDQ
jgi:hypothetical protein